MYKDKESTTPLLQLQYPLHQFLLLSSFALFPFLWVNAHLTIKKWKKDVVRIVLEDCNR